MGTGLDESRLKLTIPGNRRATGVGLDEILQRRVLDVLEERICVLDGEGRVRLTNAAWNRFAHSNSATWAACGPGVDYLRICREASGPFSEGAWESAAGIGKVLRGASSMFTLDYPFGCDPNRRWFRLTAQALNLRGDGALITHAEISHEVQLAERLRWTEARYTALLEVSRHTASVLDVDGTIQYLSPGSEATLGYRAEELIGRHFYEFVHPGDAEALRGTISGCDGSPGRECTAEYRFRSPDGTWRRMAGVARWTGDDPAGNRMLISCELQAQPTPVNSLPERCRELESLVAHLLREQEEERRRTSLELQNHLGRKLAILLLEAAHGASRGEGGRQWACHIQEGLSELRRDLNELASALHPSLLDYPGLSAALSEYCKRFGRLEHIAVEYEDRRISTHVPAMTASALYEVGCESLAHVAEHAHGTHIWVTLSGTPEEIRLSVRDDGQGFPPGPSRHRAGMGILRLRERLRGLGGGLSIHSLPGKGTELSAVVPLLPAGN